MDTIALVAIFLKLTLSHAQKTVAFVFCFTGMVRKMKPCHTLIGTFENWRVKPLTICFSFIIFIVYLLIKCVELVQWQAMVLVTHVTWVRTPGLYNFLYYFAINVHMQFQRSRRIIHIPDQPSTCTLRSSQGHRLKAHHGHRSTLLYVVQKVKRINA